MIADPHRPAVAVFGSSAVTPGTAAWADAEQCGRLLAASGLNVVTGGYGGVMEAVSVGAAACGGHVVGVTAPTVFPGRSGANASVVEEEATSSLTERIHRLLRRVDGAIALPGSLGTFTELVMAWNASHVAPLSGTSPKPIAAVGPVWRRLVESIAVDLDVRADTVRCCDSVGAAVDYVVARMSSGPGDG